MPFFSTILSASVYAVLPPCTAAKSYITDPDCILFIIFSLIIIGAFFPGISAVQIIISIFFKVSLNKSSCFFLKSSEASLAYPPSVSRFSEPSTVKNFPPKLSTSTYDAALTSVPKTIAPILFAVATA